MAALQRDAKNFVEETRSQAMYEHISKIQTAQTMVVQTTQPKKGLIAKKATIALSALQGGFYPLTVDEVVFSAPTYFFIEKKHSGRDAIPALTDVKEGLIRAMIFANLSEVLIDGAKVSHHPVLGLTSSKVRGYCHSYSTAQEIENFLTKNNFTEARRDRLNSIFSEARINSFLAFLMDSRAPELQDVIL